MAFEAYLQQRSLAPTRARRITYTVSAVVHGAGLLAAVAYSFWHVEELRPPRLTVTFISGAAAPPPPPPPPPLGGGSTAARPRSVARPRVDVQPKTPQIVQPQTVPPVEPPRELPKEAPRPTPDDAKGTAEAPPGVGTPDGVKGGVQGGVKGGVAGGVMGGAGSATAGAPARFLPPQMGLQQKIGGNEPDFPPALRTAGAIYVVMAKICVGTSGSVDTVTVLKRAHPILDSNVGVAVKGWKFRPLLANGNPVPFCYFGRFEFKSE